MSISNTVFEIILIMLDTDKSNVRTKIDYEKIYVRPWFSDDLRRERPCVKGDSPQLCLLVFIGG